MTQSTAMSSEWVELPAVEPAAPAAGAAPAVGPAADGPQDAEPGAVSEREAAGRRLLEERRLEEAAAEFATAVEEAGPNPGPRLLRDLAETYDRLDRLEDALAVRERLTQVAPDDAEAWMRLAVARRRLKKFEASLEAMETAVRLAPESAEYQYELGLSLGELKRLPDAKKAYLRATELDPHYADAFNNLGVVCQELEQMEEAERHLRESVRLNPANPSSLNNLGVALSEARRYAESIDAFHRVLAVDPEYTIAWNNLANSLRAVDRNEEAAMLLQRVVERKPDYAEAYNNLALVQIQLGRLREAMRNFDRALVLRPDYPDCRVNRAMKYLLGGDFERGWTDYEWRWHTKHLRGRRFYGRKWDGSSLVNRRILVGCEQGLGDTIQFIRFAAELKQRGATVVFEGQPPAQFLLSRTPGIDEYVPQGQGLPPFDVYAPLLSLPGLLQVTQQSIPGAVPYVFSDPDLARRWKPRVQALGGKVRVGIVWQGNPRFGSDSRRSTRLSFFRPLAGVEGVRLVSLQRGFGNEQVSAPENDFPVATFAGVEEQSDGWLRTAAIMKNLDLVIAVDTSVAHLAGAMGLPVWLIVPFANDWRWLIDREDTPWYPTMRIFRQKVAGDWSELFERMTRALEERAAEPSHAAAEPTDAQRRECDALVGEAGELSRKRDFAAAAERLQKAAALDPGDWRPYHDIGVLHAQQGRLGPAMGLFRRAIGLAPSSPMAYANLGLAYLDNHQAEEAVAQFRSALRLGGGTPDVHNNLGRALSRLGDLAAAESSFLAALRLRPDFAPARQNLAGALLSQGKFEQGWLEYEWRDRTPARAGHTYRGPRWAGEGVRGRTVLLYADGDAAHTLLFLRFARALKIGGARVLLDCPPRLAALAATCPWIDQVVPADRPLPRYDAHSPLQGLAALMHVDAANLAQGVPCLLPADTDVGVWKARLKALSGVRVGVAWQVEARDEAGEAADDRLPPWLRHLVGIPGVTPVWIERRPAAVDSVTGGESGGVARVNLVEGRLDWLHNLASLLPSLDVLVASDDLAAHVAGSMRMPMIVAAAPSSPWPLDGTGSRTPWYPSMEIVRAPRPGDWDGAIARAADRVRALAAARGYQASSPAAQAAAQAATAAGKLHAEAVRLLGEGDLDAAVDRLESALRLNERLADAHLDLGVARARMGRLDDAVGSFRAAADLDSALTVARANIVQALLDKGDPQGAERYVSECLAAQPDAYDLRVRRGQVLGVLGRRDDAAEELERAVALRPEAPDAHLTLGRALQDAGQFERAAASAGRALELKPAWPPALNALGTALASLGRFEEAAARHREAADLQSNDAEAHGMLGSALLSAGDAAGAVKAFQQAVYLRPHHPPFHLGLGKASLQAGAFSQGWLELEWRLRLPAAPRVRPAGRRWSGQSLEGKTILFIAEAETDGTLQFLRYAKLAAAQGGRVMLACQGLLAALLSRCAYLDRVLSLDEPLPACDFHAHLMSAPIGFRTDRDTIPADVPYLQPPPSPDAGARGPGLRVGVSCAAHADELLDSVRRALPGEAEWVEITGQESSRRTVADREATQSDLDQVAGRVGDLDLLVTTDSTLAHLAGAMNVPVLFKTTNLEEWRWLPDGRRTAWYPSVRLFWDRGPEVGEAEMAALLAEIPSTSASRSVFHPETA